MKKRLIALACVASLSLAILTSCAEKGTNNPTADPASEDKQTAHMSDLPKIAETDKNTKVTETVAEEEKPIEKTKEPVMTREPEKKFAVPQKLEQRIKTELVVGEFQVKDFFLDFEKDFSCSEIEKIYGVKYFGSSPYVVEELLVHNV